LSTLLIVGGWAYFINADSFAAIWTMFGIANQMLAVIALAVVTVVLVREGKGKYFLVSAGPMVFVAITTTTAALEMLYGHQLTIGTQLAKTKPDYAILTSAGISAGLIVAMLVCTYTIVGTGVLRVMGGLKTPGIVPKVQGEAAI
jgi:carbon starvation protein